MGYKIPCVIRHLVFIIFLQRLLLLFWVPVAWEEQFIQQDEVNKNWRLFANFPQARASWWPRPPSSEPQGDPKEGAHQVPSHIGAALAHPGSVCLWKEEEPPRTSYERKILFPSLSTQKSCSLCPCVHEMPLPLIYSHPQN